MQLLEWTALEYQSLERCLAAINEHGLKAISTIEGVYMQEPFKVDYELNTNSNFETTSLILHAKHGKTKWDLRLKHADGIWTMNNIKQPGFSYCIDVDIATTPLTNTLPIRRLSLDIDAEQEIKVIYFDLFEGAIKTLSQKYKRLSKNLYHYENIPNDFEADIEVDINGLVVNYPQLFQRA